MQNLSEIIEIALLRGWSYVKNTNNFHIYFYRSSRKANFLIANTIKFLWKNRSKLEGEVYDFIYKIA